jgi:hypothetical protein
MKPSYKLPLPDPGTNIPLAAKARQVEQWLGALSLADPVEAAGLLSAYLVAHNRPDLGHGFRRQLPDLTAVACRRILNALEAEFRGMPLPMDDRQRDHVDHALELLGAVADFGKRLVQEGADRSPRLFGDNPLPGQLSRLLHTLREIMDLCYLSHRQLPEGFWLDAHQTGLLLFENGLAGTPDPARPATTLGDVYLAVLLEAIADPYHFSEQERLWTLDVIARHGSMATLALTRQAGHGGVYGIRAGADRPPYPLSWQRDVVPDCDLVLDTARLVRKLALATSRVGADGAPARAVPNQANPAYRDMLHRLKLIWGGSSQRTAVRHRPARPAERKVVVGFQQVYQHLSENAGPVAEAGQVACEVVNESLGGVALLVPSPSFRIKVGSLVCVCRGPGEGMHDIGLVRWFKTGADGVLTFGVKYLHGGLRPVLWSPAGDGRLQPGLLTDPESVPRRALPTLVTPALRMDPLACLEVHVGQAARPLRLTGRVEALPEVEVFRCAVGET